jgi:predicted MFS family arabinose efflux permease
LTARFASIVRALRQPNYGIYTAGNAVSLIGTWMQRIAVGWLTWELTQSGAWLGAMAFADLFPSVFIGPIGGAVSDRGDRVRIILVSQALACLQAATLFALTWTEAIDVGVLFALVLANGVVMGFNQPSRLALVPSLVPRQDLSTAVAINAIVFNLARFIGPALAGLLIVWVGVEAAFAANAVTFLAFILALTKIHLPAAETRPAGGRRSILGEVADGVRYAARHPGIGPLLLLSIAVSIGVRPFVELLPGFAAQVFGRGADGLAMLSSTIGIGAILSGLWLAQRPKTLGLGRFTLMAFGSVAVFVLGFAATDVFWVGLVAVAFAGVAMVLSGVGAQTLIQLTVEPDMRGRVMSLYGIIFRGGPAAGALVIGALSELFGLRWPTAGAALLTLAIWAWIWQRRRQAIFQLEGSGD